MFMLQFILAILLIVDIVGYAGNVMNYRLKRGDRIAHVVLFTMSVIAAIWIINISHAVNVCLS